MFDRGFNNRKYFKALLEQGHHLLCRVRKNAAFYYPAPQKPLGKPGRQAIYGSRAHFQHWQYHPVYVPALDKTFQLAHAVVRSKMCPEPVHLVVIRTKPKKSQPYRYFLVFTTDLTLSVEQIVYYYTLRWKIETGFRDCKQSFGFDQYRTRSKNAIQRCHALFHRCQLNTIDGAANLFKGTKSDTNRPGRRIERDEYPLVSTQQMDPRTGRHLSEMAHHTSGLYYEFCFEKKLAI